MFCPQCGAPNEDDAIFCGNCGAVLNPDEMPLEAAIESAEEVLVEEPEETVVEESFDETLPEQDFSLDELPVTPPPPPPPPPPPRYTPAPSVPTSGLAIASLILGIGGLTLLPLFGSILALIFGYMARNDIRQRPDKVTGEGLAIAGIVMGWIAVGLAVLGLLVGAGFMVCGLCGAFGAGSY
jgi:hypothetical protein